MHFQVGCEKATNRVANNGSFLKSLFGDPCYVIRNAVRFWFVIQHRKGHNLMCLDSSDILFSDRLPVIFLLSWVF